MRLVHITTVPQSLGFIAGQVDWMKARGIDVHIISSPGELLEKFGKDHGVPVYGVAMPRAITPVKDIDAVLRLARVIRRIRPDMVHAHTPKGGLLGMMAAKLARVPYSIYHMRGLLTLTATGRRKKLLSAAETLSCELADLVICQSFSLRDEAILQGLVTPEKSTVLVQGSNGINVERFSPTRFDRALERQKLGIPEGATVASFVGRLVQDKGIRELADAWGRIEGDPAFSNAHLLIVGSYEERDPVPPETRQKLEKCVRIHRVEWVNDTAPLYAASDILVLPTYREGFPNVPLEAAAMGLPVLATRVVGCVDAVQDGVTGVLVPAGDSTALEAALRRYLTDAELRHQHGDAGQRRVVESFRPEVIWEALHRIYLLAASYSNR